MSTIAVLNRQRKTRFDLRWVKRIAPCAVSEIAAVKPAVSGQPDTPFLRLPHLDVVIVSDEKIAAIHEQFMSIPGATDVITFEHGEIVISAETAKRNAPHFSQPLEHELALYMIHGLLHLHGYDDQEPADAARMRQLQTRILQKCLKMMAD